MNALTQRQAAAAARQIPFDTKGLAIIPYEVVDGLHRVVAKQLRRSNMSGAQKGARRFGLLAQMGAY